MTWPPSNNGPRLSVPRGFASGSRATIPKPLLRITGILGIGVLLLLLLTWTSVGTGDDDGAWDTTTYGERTRSGRQTSTRYQAPVSPLGGLMSLFGWDTRTSFSWSDLAMKAPPVKPVASGISRPSRKQRPNRIPRPHGNGTSPDRTNTHHRGVSRIVKPNTRPEQYETQPLPSLAEAFAHLHPILRDIKAKNPVIPQEHDLTNGIFQPFVNEELTDRYLHLQEGFDDATQTWVEGGEKRYLMVTICRQVAGMLADWFATWTVLADFLGPETLVFSLMEGPSEDGAGEIIAGAMRDHLLYIGVPPENIVIKTHMPHVDWSNSHRIQLLADLRNAAMSPIFGSETPHLSPDGYPWTAIVFYNDVYHSASHILELLHQQMYQNADMTCGWDHAGKWFYDGWVGRDMSGDLYTPFPVPEEDQKEPQKLFLSSPETRQRHLRNLPYQVFACWNGIAVMSPTPFMPPYNVRFRRGTPRQPDQAPGQEECQASESSFISWDFWKYGFGRILTVPGVHLTYGKDDARLRGWLDLPHPEKGYPEEVAWNDDPPAKVRCHDWPDKLGKGYWAWDTVRWVDPPAMVIPEGAELLDRYVKKEGEAA